MKGYKESPSFLLEFNNENFFNSFKTFAAQQDIHYTAFFVNETKQFKAVVDRKWEESVYAFVNNFNQ